MRLGHLRDKRRGSKSMRCDVDIYAKFKGRRGIIYHHYSEYNGIVELNTYKNNFPIQKLLHFIICFFFLL